MRKHRFVGVGLAGVMAASMAAAAAPVALGGSLGARARPRRICTRARTPAGISSTAVVQTRAATARARAASRGRTGSRKTTSVDSRIPAPAGAKTAAYPSR